MSWRRLLRIGIGGVVCALLVLAAGWLAQRVALGADDAGMRMRVETRGPFGLRSHGAPAARDGARSRRSGNDSRRHRRRHSRRQAPSDSTAAVVSRRRSVRLCPDDLRRATASRWRGRDAHPTCPPIGCRAKKPGSLRPARPGLRLMYVRPGHRATAHASRRSPSNVLSRSAWMPSAGASSGLQGQDTRRVPLPDLDRGRLDAAPLRGRADRGRRHDLRHRGSRRAIAC